MNNVTQRRIKIVLRISHVWTLASVTNGVQTRDVSTKRVTDFNLCDATVVVETLGSVTHKSYGI